jgi:hypothetical protein
MQHPFLMAELAVAIACATQIACSAQSNSGGATTPGQSPERESAPPKSPAPPAALPKAEETPAPDRSSPAEQSDGESPLAQNGLSASPPAPTDEIVVALPRPLVRDDDDGASALPEDRDELRKRALKEIEAGNTDDALSMIDVLLVMNPDDAELLELRGDIMLKKGLTEDAAVDFRRCCGLKRQSCCR